MKKGNGLYILLKLLVTILFVLIIAACVLAYAKYNGEDILVFGNKLDNVSNEVKVSLDDLSSTAGDKQNVNVNDLLNSLKGSSLSNNSTETLSNVSEDMLYNQLNSNEKIIYTKIKNTIPTLTANTTSIDFGNTFNDLLHAQNGENQLNDDFQTVLDTFTSDNVDLFYIDLSNVYVSTTITTIGSKKTYAVQLEKTPGCSFFGQGFTDEATRKAAIEKVEGLKNRVVNALSGSDADKVKFVHDCLVDSLQYDETLSRPNAHNVYGALVERNVVCEGYAKAFKYILDSAGIPCMYINGTGTNSVGQTESHSWNYVKINGIWYAVDVTWDDPIISGGDGTLPDDIRYKNFLKGSDTFFNNHVEDKLDGIKYPTISTTEY